MGGSWFLGGCVGMFDLEGSLCGRAFQGVFLGSLYLVTGREQQGETGYHKNPFSKFDIAHDLLKSNNGETPDLSASKSIERQRSAFLR